MRMLIVSKFGDKQTITRNFIPRVGDDIDIFYEPLPTVSKVVAFPSEERLSAIGIFDVDIEAIVILE